MKTMREVKAELLDKMLDWEFLPAERWCKDKEKTRSASGNISGPSLATICDHQKKRLAVGY